MKESSFVDVIKKVIMKMSVKNGTEWIKCNFCHVWYHCFWQNV